jgi:hypothetical protein
MSKELIQKARALLSAATPGPWRPCPHKMYVFGPGGGDILASKSHKSDERDHGVTPGTVLIRGAGAGLPMDANHDLIVAAPATIAALADALELAEAQAARERECSDRHAISAHKLVSAVSCLYDKTGLADNTCAVEDAFDEIIELRMRAEKAEAEVSRLRGERDARPAITREDARLFVDSDYPLMDNATSIRVFESLRAHAKGGD